MKKYTFLIAGGNSTLLVEGCPNKRRLEVAKRGLREVEQVGFMSRKGKLSSLEMMGGELCINATLALAKLLEGSGTLRTSGTDKAIAYSNKDGLTSIALQISYKVKGNIVLLSRIGYDCTTETTPPKKRVAVGYCSKYNMPAFGILVYQGNRIKPYIYVRDTDSFVAETACGSGSIALNLITGTKEVLQPTGERIWVKRSGNEFTLTAKVVKIGEVNNR